MARAQIGIGANLGEAAATVRFAIGALARLGRVTATSSLFRTAAWGVLDQPDFINAAVTLETDLDPYALLAALKTLEAEIGRVPTFRWGPRTIDLDILDYDGVRLDDPALTIPHARLKQRAFALVPLAQIAPAYAPLRDALPEAERAQVLEI
jgi:2-amino-4-hydroxy-6-hydroxymethyldihydropteridine diphosphokinase